MSQSGSERRSVITAFLEASGKILVLRRGDQVRSYAGRWAAVSGTIEPGATPEEQVRTELREELGLSDEDFRIVQAGEPFEVDDPAIGRSFLVHPFRVAAVHPELIQLNWENLASRWIAPEEISSLQTVPRLDEAWRRVAG